MPSFKQVLINIIILIVRSGVTKDGDTRGWVPMLSPQNGVFLEVTPKRVSKTAMKLKKSYLDPYGCQPQKAPPSDATA